MLSIKWEDNVISLPSQASLLSIPQFGCLQPHLTLEAADAQQSIFMPSVSPVVGIGWPCERINSFVLLGPRCSRKFRRDGTFQKFIQSKYSQNSFKLWRSQLPTDVVHVWLCLDGRRVEESSAALEDNTMDQLIILPGLCKWISNSLAVSLAPYTMYLFHLGFCNLCFLPKYHCLIMSLLQISDEPVYYLAVLSQTSCNSFISNALCNQLSQQPKSDACYPSVESVNNCWQEMLFLLSL